MRIRVRLPGLIRSLLAREERSAELPTFMELPRRVDHFINVVTRPIEYCSLFYGLNYLVDVKGVEEFADIYGRVVDDLHTAFYDFGVFTVGEELWDMHFAFCAAPPRADGLPIDPGTTEIAIFHERLVKREPEKLRMYAMRAVRNAYPELPYGEQRALAWMIEQFITLAVKRELVRADVEAVWDDRKTPMEVESEIHDFCMKLEKHFSAFSRPETFLRRAKLIFEITPQACDCVGWHPFYGGKRWARLTDTLLLRGELPKKAWIDACWGAEHQSGNFVAYQLWVAESDRYLIESVEKRRLQEPEEYVYRTLLPYLLLAKREGDMKVVLSYALLPMRDRLSTTPS